MLALQHFTEPVLVNPHLPLLIWVKVSVDGGDMPPLLEPQQITWPVLVNAQV